MPCLAQEDDAELVFQETTIRVDKNKLVQKHYFEIQINNRSGDRYTEVEIPTSKMNRVSNISAYIKDSGGYLVKKLDKNAIKEHSSFSSQAFYQDRMMKEFTLKSARYPYTLCYEYEVKSDEFIFVEYWTPIIGRKIKTRKAILNVSSPKDFKINFRSQYVDLFKSDTINNVCHYSWETSSDGGLVQEKLSPPMSKYLPQVVVVPEDFKYETKGSFKTWKDYGYWEHCLIEELNDLPSSERSMILDLVKDIPEEKEKVKALFRFMQDETRYINISIKTGGLRPYPASYVVANRYGDCKALSNYFKAVLNEIGVESYYSSIQAGGKIERVVKNFPSQQANHVILCVPFDSDTMWLDCTSSNPFGYVGTFIQNRDIFVVKGKNSFFTKTPALRPEDVLQERKVYFQYAIKNVVEAAFENEYRGELFETLNQVNNSFNSKEESEILRKHIVEKGFTLEKINSISRNRDSTFIQLNYSASSNDIFKAYGNDLLIKLLPFAVPKFEKPEERKLPLQIDFPVYKKDRLVYKIPSGFTLINELEDKTIETRFGNYQLSFKKGEQEIIVSKQFLLNEGQYPLKDYPAFYDFVNSVWTIENRTYITTQKLN